MGDARRDAEWIVADVLAGLDDTLPYPQQADKVLDALSGRLHAELAIEAGAMERVGWQRSSAHDETIHRLVRTDQDAARRGERPVWRLTEETDR